MEQTIKPETQTKKPAQGSKCLITLGAIGTVTVVIAVGVLVSMVVRGKSEKNQLYERITKYEEQEAANTAQKNANTLTPEDSYIIKSEVGLPCVKTKSVGRCGKCRSKDQCKTGFCCPFIKKCVNSSRDSCYYPIAGCTTRCYDNQDQEKCKCNEDYPKKWAGETCNTGGSTITTINPLIIHDNGMRMAGKKELSAFHEQNRIRTNPRAVQKVVKEQISRFDRSGKIMSQTDGINLRTNEGIGAWHEAYRVLGSQSTFPNLEWNDYLALAAEDHCKNSGPSGLTGHTGLDGSSPWDRMDRYGTWGGTVGENIAYGRDKGDGYMVQLYIDDGVPNRGHRVNILKPGFKLTGMAVCSHQVYGQQIVVTYAGSFTPNEQGKRQLAKRAKNQ